MKSVSLSPVPGHTYRLPTSNSFLPRLHFPSPHKFHFANRCSFKLRATRSCSKEQDKGQNHRCGDGRLFHDYYPSNETPEPQSGETEREEGYLVRKSSGISSNTWCARIRAALGQRINLEGIAFSVRIFTNQKLIVPHVTVSDIRYIDWAVLKNWGFEGVVFDKDNTITLPYSLSLWAPLKSSLGRCKSLFGNSIAVFSNSAGLYEFDPDGRRARILEDAIGIKVIRHKVKKPAESAEEIEKHFGCESSRLIMVGDRPFTDIVYGNRNGFFTILTEPLSSANEPLIVKQVRLVEKGILCKSGLKPISHKLVSDPSKCVKDEPISYI